MAVDMIARAIAMSKASIVDGKVPASELPSYVDDVVEYASAASFPATGEQSKIYIALDTNTSYRWSGSTYIPITGQPDWNQTDTTAPDYIKNKPTLGTAAASNVASAIGDTSDIPTAAQVNTALAGKQDTLTTAQQAAADSGITAAKVSTYDGYATSKLSAADVFGRGTQIPKDTDLDDFKTIGRYYSGDSTRTGTLVNKPFTGTGFDMIVMQSYQASGEGGINQIAFTVSGGAFTVKMRAYRYSGSPGAWSWTDWQTLAFTTT